jgi:hypothetical protein
MRAADATIAVIAVIAGCHGLEKYSEHDGITDTGTDVPWDSGVDVPFDGPVDTRVDTGTDGPVDPGVDDVSIDPTDPCASFPGLPCAELPYLSDGSLMAYITMRADTLDLYLLVDTTGSMDTSASSVASAFTASIVPAATAAFADVQFGLGHFNDFPSGGYGDTTDMPYWHMTDITTSASSVQSGLDTLPGNTSWGSGLDAPESNTVALQLTASGDGISAGGASIPARTCSAPGATGYPCFRANAFPVVMMISDAEWHNGPGGTDAYSFTAPDYDDAVIAFMTNGMQFLGLHVNNYGTGGLSDMNQFGINTGSLDDMGQPFVSTGTASTCGSRAASLVSLLGAQARFDVVGHAEDVPGDPPSGERDARLFVQAVTPHSATPPSGLPAPTFDASTFFDARQDTELVFTVALRNDDFPSGSTPVAHRAWIVAMGDGRVEVGRQEIVIVVP